MPTYTIGSVNPAGAANGSGTGIGGGDMYLTKRILSGAAAGAKWTALRAWITGASSGTFLHCRICIYDDLSNSPNNLVGGGEVIVPQLAAAAEYTVALPGTANATDGNYWVGFHIESTVGPCPWYASGVTGATLAYGSPGPTYSGGLPATFSETGVVSDSTDVRVAADAATVASTDTLFPVRLGGGSLVG